MRFTSKTVARAAAFGVAAAAIALPVATATGANASSRILVTPTLTSNAPTPAVNGKDKFATNNETVTVTGTNFTALTPYTLEQCSGANSCDTATTVTGTTDSGGGISTSIVVHTGKIGTGICGKATPSTLVPSDTQCYLEVTDTIDPATDTSIFFNPIVSMSVSSNLKNGQTVTVGGGGFLPSKGMFVLECSAPSLTDCDTGTLVQPFPLTASNGTLSGVHFKIVTGALGGTAPPCTSAKACLIVVASDANDHGQQGQSPFTVAKFANKATKTAAKASSKKPKAGKKFSITGTVTASGKGVRAQSVTLMDRVGSHGKFKKAGTATTKAGGKFTFKVKGPKKKTQYEVVHAKQIAPGVFYGASTSKKLSVK